MMMKNTSRWLLLTAALATVTACGGGGGTNSVPTKVAAVATPAPAANPGAQLAVAPDSAAPPDPTPVD